MPQSFGSLSGPAGLLLGSLYTGLSFALGHSSKSKEGCVGDRLTLPRPARRGRPSPAPPASELGRSRGPPGARHPRRPLMPSPPALLPRDSRRRTIARIVLVNAKEVVPPANRARPPGQSPPGHVGPTGRPGGISSNTWGSRDHALPGRTRGDCASATPRLRISAVRILFLSLVSVPRRDTRMARGGFRRGERGRQAAQMVRPGTEAPRARRPPRGPRPCPRGTGPSPPRAGHRRSGPPRRVGSWAPREQVLASRSGKRGARLRRRRRGLL